MRIPKVYQCLPILVGILTSCQLGPFYYTLDRDADGHKESSVHHTGHHGAAHAGSGYTASKEACLLARDLTDEEMDAADDLPGGGYKESEWCGENPDQIALNVFDCEDGDLIILDDDGEITVISKLHFFEGKDGKKYIFDDETDEMVEFDMEKDKIG